MCDEDQADCKGQVVNKGGGGTLGGPHVVTISCEVVLAPSSLPLSVETPCFHAVGVGVKCRFSVA